MQELRFAWKHTLPILFTYLFIGIAFGVQMAEAGYSAVWSVASAFFIYAGSLQIVMVSLLRQGVPLLTVPRTRGGDPGGPSPGRLPLFCSPHTRG